MTVNLCLEDDLADEPDAVENRMVNFQKLYIMRLNCWMKRTLAVGRVVVNTLLCLVAIAFVWQGAFFSNTNAIAAPATLIAADVGDQVKGAADEVRARSKDLIRDTQDKVEKTADKNAAKVDQADDEGTFVERKAKRDQARIEKRAEEDANRTEKAVDKSMNAVQGAVDKIKDVFSK